MTTRSNYWAIRLLVQLVGVIEWTVEAQIKKYDLVSAQGFKNKFKPLCYSFF